MAQIAKNAAMAMEIVEDHVFSRGVKAAKNIIEEGEIFLRVYGLRKCELLLLLSSNAQH